MKCRIIYFLIMTCFVIPEDKKKSENQLRLNPGMLKGLSLDLIPKDVSARTEKLIDKEILAIKETAKKFKFDPVGEEEVVLMETSSGKIILELYENVAPNHCNNFKRLANSGFYDGTLFHRVIKGFMIQGGDILSRDNDPSNDGQGNPGWTVGAEFSSISHGPGILSMARSQNPNSAGSQFFICHEEAKHLDGKYTVFGKVIDNFYVVQRIANAVTEKRMLKRLLKNKIPDGEKTEKWMEFRKQFVKVPNGMNPNDYRVQLSSYVNSDRPLAPIKILKVRVVKKMDIENE
tara:strand:- start:77 stop:946 length:870 start_codon:yes stop_codon:yes gene_type:complete